MEQRVILKLSEGSFDQGFSVNLRIRKEGETAEFEDDGKLPPTPTIPQSFSQWQEDFRLLVKPGSCASAGNRSRIKITGGVSQPSCKTSAEKLAADLNDWLNSDRDLWKKIRDYLQQHLNPDDEIRVIIQTEDIKLRQLPWPAWKLFSEVYERAEIALSAPKVKPPSGKPPENKQSKVRILAVLGNSDNINIQFDRQALEKLGARGAEIEFLEQPAKKELLEWLWNPQGWHIFFFAGHSSSVDGHLGEFEINSKESLSIYDLKNAMKSAIGSGLQLAIFNSCDGLGLANQLAQLHLPQCIVMREPVPDEVAQEFLQNFLAAFSSHKSLYASVREARLKLEDAWNKKYPGTSWLPVICQNPAVEPPTWQGFIGEREATLTRRFRVDSVEGTWICAHTLTGHSDQVNSVAISPDNQTLASASNDQTIKLWHLQTGQLLHTITGHSGEVRCVTFSRDGQTLASSSAFPDGTIKLWHAATGELKSSLRGDDWVFLSVGSIALSPDGQALASGHFDNTVKVWNLQTGELRHTLRGHVGIVHSVAISPDGLSLASGSSDSNIKICNLNTGREIRNLNGPGESPLSLVQAFLIFRSVYTVAFSPDGQTLASGGLDQPIQLWRMSDGEQKSTLKGHSNTVFSVAFSPDGTRLASGSADRTIRIWDLFTGEPTHILGHSGTVESVAFSPDGRTLVSGSKDRTVKIWRLSV